MILKKLLPYVIAILLAGSAVALYWTTLGHDFVNFDDFDLVVRNNAIKALSIENITAIFTPGGSGAYQPVRTLSYAIDYHFWRLTPAGYHLTNILCHAATTVLLYLIVQLLTRHLVTATCAALLFAIHPIHVEAVTWISGRRDVLSALFTLMAFYSFLRLRNAQQQTRQPQRGSGITLWYLSAILWFTLGLLTKPVVIVFPLLLLLVDICCFFPLRTIWRKALWYVPFVVFGGLYMQIFLHASRASGVAKSAYHGGHVSATFLTMVRVFAEYMVMLLVPHNLSVAYGVTPIASWRSSSFLIAVALLGIVALLAIWTWKHARLAFCGILWCCIGLLPVSNIIPIAIVKADRYLYLPSVGFCLFTAWMIVRGGRTRSRLQASLTIKRLLIAGYWILLGGVALSYIMLTVKRNADWKDSQTLWAATLETHPNSPVALNNLGLLYADQGAYEKAIALYEQLVEFHPNEEHLERVYKNLADAYAAQGQSDQAITYYEKALAVNPEYVEAYLGLGNVSLNLGQYGQAEAIYLSALEFERQQDQVYNHLGNLALIQGSYDKALAYFREALGVNPYSMNAYNGLGTSYAAQGETEQAVTIYLDALHKDPDSPDTSVIRNSLGTLYMNRGETDLAIAEFLKSVAIKPANADVRQNLGILYLRTGQYPKAAQEFIAALKYQPDDAKILSNLGTTYTHVGLYDEAIQMFRWALESDPSLARTHMLLGDVCAVTNQKDCAVEAYQKALALQPDSQTLRKKLDAVQGN